MFERMDIIESDDEKKSFTRLFLKIFLILVVAAIAIFALLFLIAIFIALSSQPVFQVEDVYDSSITFSEKSLRNKTEIFAESLRFKTVSRAAHEYDTVELMKMNEFLVKSFPLIFKASYFIKWQTINNYSLLISIQGMDRSLAPYMLASHLDVVPTQADQWTRDPFLGQIIKHPSSGEEVVWGRGAIDDKSGVIGILSALELLLEQKWRPRRSFYIAFGHDEEVSGFDGAHHIGQYLQENGVKLEFIIDEGMPMSQGIIPAVDVPVALIGVTEKGWANVLIETEGEGGHSSIPPKDQAIDRLSKAISNLYDYPQPSMYGTGPEVDMLRYLSTKAGWPHRLVYSNQWLFAPMMSSLLTPDRASNAIIRTTTAVTRYKGGIKDNIIPAKVSALINHRVHPGQTLTNVLENDIYSIGDEKVKVSLLEGDEPHPISPYGSESAPFRLIASCIKKVFPDAVTVPGIMVANTDTRHYTHLSKNIYRMYPIILQSHQVSLIHGADESLPTQSFHNAIRYYSFIMMNANHEYYTSSLDGRHLMS